MEYYTTLYPQTAVHQDRRSLTTSGWWRLLGSLYPKRECHDFSLVRRRPSTTTSERHNLRDRIRNHLIRMDSLQLIDGPLRDVPPYTNLLASANVPLPMFLTTHHLNPHLLHPLQLAHRPDRRVRALIRPKLPHPRALEAAMAVLAARVRAGADGEEGGFAGLEGGDRDVEGQGVGFVEDGLVGLGMRAEHGGE